MWSRELTLLWNTIRTEPLGQKWRDNPNSDPSVWVPIHCVVVAVGKKLLFLGFFLMFHLSQTTAAESPFWTSGRVDTALGRSPFSQFNPDPPLSVWGSGLIRSPPPGQLPLMTHTTVGSLAALQPFKVVKEEMKSPSSGPRSSSVAYQNWCHFCPGSCQGACFWHQAGVTFSSAEWAWLTQWMVGMYSWLRQQEMMKIGPTYHERCAQSKASVTKDGSPTACSQWAEFCTWVCCMKCWSWDTFLCSCKVF